MRSKKIPAAPIEPIMYMQSEPEFPYGAVPSMHAEGRNQRTLLAVLAAMLIVIGAYPLAVETEDAPYGTFHRALLWIAVVVGSIVLAMLLAGAVLKIQC